MNQTSDFDKAAADPFAADIFASETHAPTAENFAEAFAAGALPNGSEKPVSWSARLPKVPRTAVRWDDLWRNLPPVFSGELAQSLAESLARLLNFPAKKTIEFLFAGKREINRAENFAPENSLWLSVGAGETAEIAVEIDDALAVWLVDAALNGAENSGDVIARASLTPSENAVLEFLALNLTHAANQVLDAPPIRFRRLSRRIPDHLRQTIEAEIFSLLALEWQIDGEFLPPSVVKIYLAPEALQFLQSKNNGDGAGQRRSRAATARSLERSVKTVRARLSCGDAELNFGELAALETGDVLLLENHGLFAQNDCLAGRAEVFFGDGDNQKLTGELAFFNADARENEESFEESGANVDNKIPVRRINLNRSPQISIENFIEAEAPPFDNFMTETNDDSINNGAEDDAADEQGGLAVENLVVSLRVELEARRLTLAEVGGLRENQTLELAVKPTDEVNILIDGRVVGRGELVAVEDRLGVRITKLMR